MPLTVLGFLMAMPKQSLAADRTKQETLPTSWYFVKTMFFLLLTTVIMFTAVLCMCLMKIRKISVQRYDSEIANEQAYTGLYAD